MISGYTYELVKWVRASYPVRSLGPIFNEWEDCVKATEVAAYEFINCNAGCCVYPQDDAFIIRRGKEVVAAFICCTVYRGPMPQSCRDGCKGSAK